MSRIKVEGLPGLQRALEKAAGKARTAAVAAVTAEVDAIADDVQATAPKDTGALRASIRREPKGLEGTVSATARYAGFVEHGTYKDPAQPYMGPAAERSRKRFPAKAGAIIKSMIEGRRP